MLAVSVNQHTTLSMEVAHIVAVWTEVLLYGVYTCLFLEASYIVVKKREENIACEQKVCSIMTLLMYILSTAHVGLNLYRMLRAYVWQIEAPGLYFLDASNWETTMHSVMLCVMTWLGDGLVIYRCWVVWNYNYWVITLPLILLMLEFAFQTMILVWFTHPKLVSFNVVSSWLGTIYPLAFVQNVATTGMIALKIWTQHRSSTANGVIDTSSNLSLIRILRILIESAAIYTIQLLILLILYPLKSNAQFILQSAMIPSIGIVFVLITVRVHFTKTWTFNHSVPLEVMPDWSPDVYSSHGTPSVMGFSSRTRQLDVKKYNDTDPLPSQDISFHQI